MVSPCLPTTTQADSGDSNLTRGKAGGKAPPVSKAKSKAGQLGPVPPPAKNGGAGPPNSGSALVDLVENMLKAAPPAPGAGPAPKQQTSQG